MAALLSACTSPGAPTHSLISNKNIYLTPKIGMPIGNLAAGAVGGLVIYLVYDPLAPNWEIEESRLSDDVYHLDLRMKRYHTGGAGESIQVLKRRAAQLQREAGYEAYQLVEYSEGIDSKTLGAQRVAEGTIKLLQRLPKPVSVTVSNNTTAAAFPLD